MISHWYTDSFTIRRRTVAKDSGGAPKREFSIIGTYLGQMQQERGSERFTNEQKEPADQWRLFCPQAVPIANRDIISYDSKDYEVVGIENYKLSFGANEHQEILLVYYGESSLPILDGMLALAYPSNFINYVVFI